MQNYNGANTELTLLWRLKKYQELTESCLSYLKLGENNAIAYRYLAVSSYMQGSIDDALKYILKAKEHGDTLAYAWNFLFTHKRESAPKEWQKHYNTINKDLRASLDPHKNYPFRVGIEIGTLCNAKCAFCPYSQQIERKHNIMSLELFEKILYDLSAIPQELPLEIEPHLLTEPFMIKDVFTYYRAVNKILPKASLNIFTNASLCDQQKIKQLSELNIGLINISLNDIDPVVYKEKMGLDLNKTLANIDLLHETFDGKSPYIAISRICDNSSSDLLFKEFVEKRYPKFALLLQNYSTWTGDSAKIADKDETLEVCFNWNAITIASTGQAVLCCMDGEAVYNFGNAKTQNILDIYNSKEYKKYRSFTGQKPPAPCSACSFPSG